MQKKIELIDIENLSLEKARLLRLPHAGQNYFIYALNVSYDDVIDERLQFHHHKCIKRYYKNAEKQPLTIVAIKQETAGTKSFAAAKFNEQYSNTAHVSNTSSVSQWQAIVDPKKFEIQHSHHLLHYYANLLDDSTPMRALKKQLVNLQQESMKNTEAKIKYEALKRFISSLYSGEYNNFFDILEGNDNPTYKAMIEPRIKIYNFKISKIKLFNFTLDFTAKSPQHTNTFQTLKNLTHAKEFLALKQEYVKQIEESVDNANAI